ncbi:MAG TPA: serine/threonine-protein kinase [Gemmataceae bacterium]|nr:serine/threonine-protein kinase [Gemmataceae bacterium]
MNNGTQPSLTPPPAAGVPAAEPDLTGRTLGDFHVLRRLGHGGMGQVYLAEQVSLKRKVALKILRADLAANPDALQRFQQEALAVARATHANIVQVYAIGECDGLHYMALEYVEGRNLREYLARKGPPDVPQVLAIMRQVAAALQRAGELGIIHRDIKPENILLTRKGEVKVADFGLSRCLAPDQAPLSLTQSGVTLGTPLYMSPEQVEGRPVDPRTDIYSFGVTCYHLLAGHPPFQGQTAFQVALQHVQAEPVPLEVIRPDLPAELCAVVKKMMAKDPAERYQTAGELLQDLTRLRETLTGLSSGLHSQVLEMSSLSGTPAAVPAAPSRRRGLPWAAALSVVLALAGGAAVAWFRHASRNLPPPSEPPASNAELEKIEAMFSPQKREQVLQAGVELYINPGNDPQMIRLGARHCAELGVFYLEHRRLDAAERFFAKLEGHAARPYRLLGRLGQAMVLAFQDQPDESNRRFLELLNEKRPEPTRKELETLLRQNPKLHQMVAEALEHNAANATADSPFPHELDFLRKPPVPLRLRGDKPAAKGT